MKFDYKDMKKSYTESLNSSCYRSRYTLQKPVIPRPVRNSFKKKLLFCKGFRLSASLRP